MHSEPGKRQVREEEKVTAEAVTPPKEVTNPAEAGAGQTGLPEAGEGEQGPWWLSCLCVALLTGRRLRDADPGGGAGNWLGPLGRSRPGLAWTFSLAVGASPEPALSQLELGLEQGWDRWVG